MKILKTLDYIFNKVIPKKYTVMLIVCAMTYAMPVKPPDAFYYAVGIYFGGSAIVSGARNLKQTKERRYE